MKSILSEALRTDHSVAPHHFSAGALPIESLSLSATRSATRFSGATPAVNLRIADRASIDSGTQTSRRQQRVICKGAKIEGR
jgi:hypothetical protein